MAGTAPRSPRRRTVLHPDPEASDGPAPGPDRPAPPRPAASQTEKSVLSAPTPERILPGQVLHERLAEHLRTGLDEASRRLADALGCVTRPRLRAVRLRTLCDLDLAPERPEARIVCEDVIAGVVQRFGGTLHGTAILALDPNDALLWLQTGEGGGSDEDDALQRFLARGSIVLEALVRSLTFEGPLELGAGRLEERPLLAALVATHAPSDTVVLCVDGDLQFAPDPSAGPLVAPFQAYVLLEPKLAGGLLARLDER